MAEEGSGLTRRSLVSAAGIAAAGVATAAVGATVSGTARASSSAKEIRWDREADVICVGSGSAALTAAVVAKSLGAEVIVIEREARTGGTTAKSGGVHWICNNVTLRDAGIQDKRKDALEYMVRFSYPYKYIADHPTMGVTQEQFSLIEAFYDNGSEMVDYLIKMNVYKVRPWTYREYGLLFNPGSKPRSTSTPDYLDHAPEDKVKSGRAIVMQREDGSISSGTDFIDRFETYLTSRNQPVLTGHRARDLIKNSKGEVIGVVVENAGRIMHFRARKAVIFGTGGFAHNPEMIERFHKTPVHGSCAAPGAVGDIIPIATRAGAALGNMSSAWRADAPLEQSLRNRVLSAVIFVPPGDSMIYVNKNGNRFVNEHRSYTSRGKSHEIYDSTEEEYPNHVAFMIFDQRAIDIYGGQMPIPRPGERSPYVIQGSTLGELAKNIGARLEELRAAGIGTKLGARFTANLEASVQRFNGFAKSGADEDFGRGKYNFDRQIFHYISLPRDEDAAKGKEFLENPNMYPFAPSGPYYAVIVGNGVLDTIGGPVINAKSQFVDYDNRPIPGVYGAGNCIACPTREAYYGPGGTIGPAMTFGYIAAKNAVLEPIKEVM